MDGRNFVFFSLSRLSHHVPPLVRPLSSAESVHLALSPLPEDSRVNLSGSNSSLDHSRSVRVCSISRYLLPAATCRS